MDTVYIYIYVVHEKKPYSTSLKLIVLKNLQNQFIFWSECSKIYKLVTYTPHLQSFRHPQMLLPLTGIQDRYFWSVSQNDRGRSFLSVPLLKPTIHVLQY